MNEVKKERMLELLADQAAFGLPENEAVELEMLLKEFPEWEDDNSFELAAAAINLASLDDSEPLPAALRTKIVADAEKYFGATAETVEIKSFASQIGQTPAVQTVTETEPGMPLWNWLGWAFAAAFLVAFGIMFWTSRTQDQPVVENPPKIQTPTPELPIPQKRQLLLNSANAIRANLMPPKPDAPAVTGDIVWDNQKQEGYVRFQNLPVNDANKESYQLWIVDENQNPKTPVDGGVFNVSQNGEIIVPIDAKLKIGNPKMFAVTKEKAGGVVVSDLKGLMAIAKI